MTRRIDWGCVGSVLFLVTFWTAACVVVLGVMHR